MIEGIGYLAYILLVAVIVRRLEDRRRARRELERRQDAWRW